MEAHNRENDPGDRLGTTVVIGLGSPFGDDQAGWRLIDMLQKRPHVQARLQKVQETTQLINELDGCTKLIIVDACRGLCRAGAVTQLEWPDPRIAKRHSQSTHGVSLCEALQLAERLGRLPAAVKIYGIEIRDCQPGHEICLEVLQTVTELEAMIYAELCEAVYA